MNNLVQSVNEHVAALTGVLKALLESSPDALTHNQVARQLSSLGEAVSKYFENDSIQTISALQPVTLREKITNATLSFQKINTDVEHIQREEATLLAAEQALTEKEKQHRALLQQLENLRRLEQHLAALDQAEIGSLMAQKNVLQDRVQGLLPVFKGIEEALTAEADPLLEAFKDQAERLAGIVEAVNKKQNDSADLLKGGLEQLKNAHTERQKNYNDLITDFNECAGKLAEIESQIKEIAGQHATNLQIYQKHFAENKNIWGALHEPTAANRLVTERMTEIEGRLAELDSSLRTVLHKKMETYFSPISKRN